MESSDRNIARVTLVTGSARGLGLATARRLARRGDRVHVVWRSSSSAADELSAEFDGRVHRADLQDAAQARRLVREVIERDQRLDCVVHAVGEYVSGRLDELAGADLSRMWTSNVESAAWLVDAARAELRRARGSVVLFGCAGLESLRARRRTAAYTAAKTALAVLVRSWAMEEAPHGVRLNMVSPGWIPHPHADPDTLDAARHAALPLGRAGTPEEIAEAVEFLTSERARYVTGADLPVAGGYLL